MRLLASRRNLTPGIARNTDRAKRGATRPRKAWPSQPRTLRGPTGARAADEKSEAPQLLRYGSVDTDLKWKSHGSRLAGQKTTSDGDSDTENVVRCSENVFVAPKAISRNLTESSGITAETHGISRNLTGAPPRFCSRTLCKKLCGAESRRTGLTWDKSHA